MLIWERCIQRTFRIVHRDYLWLHLIFLDVAENQEQMLYHVMRDSWPLVNELEQAWTSVEESDRAIISKLALQDNHKILILVCPLQYTI